MTTENFAVTREFDGAVSEVFEHFTKPEGFSRWFVVPGFRTPAERLELEPRAGGGISGVMVAEVDGSEIAFTAEYGEVEEPRLVEFKFTNPTELVRITLEEVGSTARLTYRHYGAPPSDRERAVAAVGPMLDGLAASLRDG